MSNANTHGKPLDVVIKTRGKDLHTYLHLQRDLLRHSRLRGRVYVIVHPKDLAEYEKVVDDNFILTTMNHALKAFGYERDLQDTWGTQQIIKLLASGIVSNEQYLVMDANTLINYDFDETHFYRDGHFIYAIDDLTDEEWEGQARRFLNLDPEGVLYGFRSTNQVFIKSNVFALVEYLEKLYGRNIVEILDSEPEAWTEFKLYGYFCRCILKGGGHFYQPSGDVTSVNKIKVNVPSYVAWIKFRRPLMVKVYKHRPTHELSMEEYEEFVAQIKLAYQR
jgi:hypothetical protein